MEQRQPTAWDTTAIQARAEFLRAIKQYAPNALTSLAQSVLPSYRVVYPLEWKFWYLNLGKLPSILGAEAQHIDSSVTLAAKLLSLVLQSQPPSKPNPLVTKLYEEWQPLEQFLLTLIRWAKDFNLKNAWCFYEAIRTLDLWCIDPSNMEDWAYTTNYQSVPFMSDEQAYRWAMAWDPKADTWKSYRDRALKLFREYLEDYRATVQRDDISRARQHGEANHFKWLVEYQVCKFEVSQIVKKSKGAASIDASTVHGAIHSLAKLIQLTLRPAKLGRHS